jgi:hypothetical protein
MVTYESNAEIGVKYVDIATGFTGTCCSVAFYADGPPRVQLAALTTEGTIAREWFDASSLTKVPTGF